MERKNNRRPSENQNNRRNSSYSNNKPSFERSDSSDVNRRFDRNKKSDREKDFDNDKNFSRENSYRRDRIQNSDRKFGSSERYRKSDKEEGYSRERSYNRDDRNERDKKSYGDKRTQNGKKFERDDDSEKNSRSYNRERNGRSNDGKDNKRTSYRDNRKFEGKGREDNFDRDSKSDRNKSSYRDNKRGRTNSFDNDKSFDSEKKFKKEHIIQQGYGRKSEGARLNKYIANSGICSRRDADIMISTGNVTINGKVVTTLGYKVQKNDLVCVDGKQIKPEKPVYLLLNKPKDYITTTDDPMNRRTVMELIKDACKERIFPVGRLDRNTTGVLLFTNDGDMAKKLMHPKHKIKKVYHATLNRNLEKTDMESIAVGVEIDGETIAVDAIGWKDYDSKSEAEIHIHSGQYHVVKRIFEKFDYNVIRLDRVKYGPLTKKNLQRGRWRFLTEEEISILHRI